MNIWHDMDSKRINPDYFIAVIEIPKNGTIKYELDKDTGLLKMDRVLYTSTRYPANYGFIPKTLAGDNDPLDVLVLCSQPVYPMTLIRCYTIGCIKMIDSGMPDEKIIAIPYGDPHYNCYKKIGDLPNHIFDETTHFFTVYKALENKDTAVIEIVEKDEAEKIISSCIDRYDDAFSG